MQEHRYYHSELELKYHDIDKCWTFVSSSAWKNSVNAAIESVGICLSSHALKSVNNIEKTQPRII